MTPKSEAPKTSEQVAQLAEELENGINRGLKFARSINPGDAVEFLRSHVETFEKLFQRFLEMAQELNPDQFDGLKGVERVIAQTSVRNAIDLGDFGLLEHRLKKNLISCDLERRIAGQVLSRELKRSANRPKSWKTDHRNQIIQMMVMERICNGDKFKHACEAVADEAEVSFTTVHNACGGLIWMRDTFPDIDLKVLIWRTSEPVDVNNRFLSIRSLPYCFNCLELRSRAEPEAARQSAGLFLLMSIIKHGIWEAKNLEASIGLIKSDT